MDPMKRSTVATGGVSLGIAVMIGLAVLFSTRNTQRDAGLIEPEGKTPAQQGDVVAPQNQPIGKAAKKVPVQKGVLQKNVSHAKVTTELTVVTGKDFPSFVTEELTVKPGEVVRLTLKNNSSKKHNHYHNWVLTKPNKAEDMDMAGRKAGPQQDWVPDSPDVLAHTRLLAPGETDTIVFQAPNEIGDYPYVSTFPGQARNPGILHVKKG